MSDIQTQIAASIRAGFGKNGGREFVGAINKGNTLHRGLCIDNERLKELADVGQKDLAYGIISSPSLSLDGLCKLGPADVFSITCSSGLVLKTSQPYNSAEGPRSVHAAVNYAALVLGATKFRLVLSDNDPILPYIMQTDRKGQQVESTGPFMDLYRPHWDQALQPLREKTSFRQAYITEKFRLTAIELVQKSASNIDDMLRMHDAGQAAPRDFSVVPYLYDAEDDRLIKYDRARPGAAYQEDQIASGVQGGKPQAPEPEYFACSCCDSRGLLRYAFGAKPGQIHEMNTIGAIVPSYHDVLQWGHPSSTWLQIEVALANGCKDFALAAHYDCGGIKGLVNWCKTGAAPHEPHLVRYLGQAKLIGDRVIKFAKKNGFIEDNETLYRLTEMHVARWSARNIKTKAGEGSNVLAGHLDLSTREFYPLPMIDTKLSVEANIAATYEMLQLMREKKLMNIAKLYSTLASPKRAEMRAMLEDTPSRTCSPC